MFDIIKILQNIPKKTPVVMLIRHAEKYPESNFICNGITDNGQLESKNLAKKLSNRNIEIINTSAVKRCVMTAESFVNVHNSNPSIKTTRVLGDPGAFIKDSKVAANIFLTTNDIYSIIDKYYQNKILPGFVHIDIGANKIVQSILSCLKLRKTALYISHDFIMGAFIAKIISGDLFTNGRIDYLNGVCFTLEDNNKMIVHLKDQSFIYNVADKEESI